MYIYVYGVYRFIINKGVQKFFIDHDQNQNIKVDIPHCTREKQPKEVLNRLNEVERVSKFLNLPENERGKLVAIKLKGYASSKW